VNLRRVRPIKIQGSIFFETWYHIRFVGPWWAFRRTTFWTWLPCLLWGTTHRYPCQKIVKIVFGLLLFQKKLNWTDKVQLNRRPTGKGFRPLNRSGSVVVCAQESSEVEKQVIFLRVPSCATSLCRRSDYRVRKLGGPYA